jgi:tetratricopeptide (TPR) repeat protein
MANKHGRGKLVRVIIWLFACVIFAPAEQLFAQANPTDVDRAFAHATQLHETGDIEGAIRSYQAILASNPNRADVRSNLGAAYSRLGRYEDAIEQYKRALAPNRHNQTIRFNLALAYYKAAWFAEAASELTLFLAAVPKDLPERQNAVLLLADSQVRLGEYRKVIDLLTTFESLDLNNRTVAYLFGSALIGDGQVKRGQEVIDRVFRDEDSAEARLLMGSILLLADDGKGAIKELERAIQLNPKLPSLQAWYGRALMRLGDSEKAKTAFKNELAINPNNFDANLYTGVLLKQDKFVEEALTYLSRAARLRPRDSYARYHLGGVYFTLGKLGEALPLLEGVVKEYPDFIEAHVLLASVYYRLNRKGDGDREQEIVRKLNAEQQAKQPGAQDGASQINPVKSPPDRENNQNHR